MKNIRINFLIAILLVGGACYFIFRNNFSTVRKEDRDFAIEDTAAVTKIFLADKNNHSVTLEKNTTGQWMLNGKEKTRQQGIDLIYRYLKKNPCSDKGSEKHIQYCGQGTFHNGNQNGSLPE